MKAVFVRSPGERNALVVTEVPVPTPGPGQVLIRTRYAAVNFADVKRRRGEFAAGMPATDFVPGIEASGEIVALGPDVEGHQVGDQVVALMNEGAYAQFAVADAAATFSLPSGPGSASLADVAAFGVVSFTAYLALATFGRALRGESVLITSAAGGVGSAATQIARALGLAPIIGAAGSSARAASALSRGADHAIDYSEQDLSSTVVELTGGRGVDIVLDAYGDPVRAAACRALAPGGRLVHYGNSSGQPEAAPALAAQREALVGLVGFSLRRCRLLRPDLLRGAAETLGPWVAQGQLNVPVDSTFALESVEAAHDRLESRQVVGKLILETHDV